MGFSPGKIYKLKAPKYIFILALAGILLALIALDREVARSSQNTTPRALMARTRASTGAQAVALGNSLIGVGFNESSFDDGMALAKQDGSINLGMGGSSAVEQLLMLRYALQQGMRPRVVVFGFFDFQLTHPLEYATRDLIGNRAMLYYMEPEYARAFYHLSLHDRAEFEIMRHFEMFVDRGDGMAARRSCSGEGWRSRECRPKKPTPWGERLISPCSNIPARPSSSPNAVARVATL